MNYDGFAVFKIYLGLKLHFTTPSYDWFKYDGKVNCKLETLQKEMIGISFIRLVKNIIEKKLSTISLQTLLTIRKSG